MADFDLKKLQEKEIEVLNELDRICKKYDITYYLAFGTLLGAIRHKGFIPWDDDIDVHMKMEDYLRFKEVCKSELNGDYFFQDIESDPMIHILWGKLRKNNTASIVEEMKDYPIHWGIGIDIFPLVPLKDKSFPKIWRYQFLLMNVCANKELNAAGFGDFGTKTNKGKWIPKCLVKPIYRFLYKRVTNACSNPKYYFSLANELYDSRIYPIDTFDYVEYKEFGDNTYPVMNGYDEYLTITYGDDYMEIPSKDKQIDHGNLIVDFNVDYSFYQKN